MRGPDLTVGQRLSFGFGVPLALLAAFVVVVYSWNARGEREHRVLIERLGPVSDATQELERSLLHAGIGTRDYLLLPDAAHLAQAQGQLAEARAALDRLEASQRQPGGDPQLAPLRVLVETYLADAQHLLDQADPRSGTGRLSTLSATREQAMHQLDRIRELQRGYFAEATAQMEHNRDLLYRQLLGAALMTLLLLAASGIWTAHTLRRPLEELLAGATAIESGDWSPALLWAGGRRQVRDEIRRLERALGVAAVALDRRDRRLKADRSIADAAAGSLVAEQIASAALAAVVEKMRAGLGVIYFAEGQAETLRPVATHAPGPVTAQIRVGEGLAGQAAQMRKLQVLRDIPPDTPFRIRLGFDEAPPRCVAAAPIVFSGQVLGVLVVGALHEFDAYSLAFLESAAAQLAAGLQNSLTHAQLRRLADDLHDKHQRIQAQAEELQAQNEELQSQSEELHAQGEEIQAQNEQLKILTDQLTVADTRKNDFLALLAHELRNPLAAISNSLHILSRPGVAPDIAATTRQVIARQTRQLTRLIDDLLDITRIVRGTLQVQTERLDFTAVVRDCMEDLKPAIDAAGMKLELVLPDQPLNVVGDRARLSQVVTNICSNAIKYRREDGGLLKVGLERAGHQALLRIADNGIGIDAAFMPRVFEPFAQASPATEGSTGLGLGLSVVKALISAHRGTVEAYSPGVGRGCEFVVRLPVER